MFKKSNVRVYFLITSFNFPVNALVCCDCIHTSSILQTTGWICSICGCVFHYVTVFPALMIGFVSKVPLVVFKREKEIARKLEFAGLYITEQPSDEDIKGQWDRLVINTPWVSDCTVVNSSFVYNKERLNTVVFVIIPGPSPTTIGINLSNAK